VLELPFSRVEAALLVLFKNAPAPSGAHKRAFSAAESIKRRERQSERADGSASFLSLPCLPLRFAIAPKKKRVTRHIRLVRIPVLSVPASGTQQAAPIPPKAGRRNVVQADRRRRRRIEAAGCCAQRAFNAARVHRRRKIAAARAERRERPPGSDRKV